jgi:hypothetical protein
MRPSHVLRVLLYPVGHTNVFARTPSPTTWKSPYFPQSSSVWCPSGSFMGLVQLVSNQPLITHQLPNQPQLVLGGEPFKTWHVQHMEPSPRDVYSVCHQASTSLPLVAEDKFIRVTSLRNCSPNKCFTEFKKQTHININCSEETVWLRPSWLNFCKETTTKGHQ